jgi:hypothetical protein
MLDRAAARGVTLLLPCDVVVARDWEDDEGCCTVELTPTCCSKERPCVPAGEGVCAAASPHAQDTWLCMSTQRGTSWS